MLWIPIRLEKKYKNKKKSNFLEGQLLYNKILLQKFIYFNSFIKDINFQKWKKVNCT